jgi:hypothetical protein
VGFSRLRRTVVLLCDLAVRRPVGWNAERVFDALAVAIDQLSACFDDF